MEDKTITECHVPNGLVNGPVSHKKIKQPHTPRGLFKLHTLCAFIGMRGSGKTHAMVNLAKEYLDNGSFTRIYIISPTYESNPIFHVLHANHEDVYENSQNSLQAVDDILRKREKDSDDFDHYYEYMKAYLRWRHKKELTVEQRTMLENNDHKQGHPILHRHQIPEK